MKSIGLTEVVLAVVGVVLVNNFITDPPWYTYPIIFAIAFLFAYFIKSMIDRFYGWERLKAPFKKIMNGIFKDV